MKMESAKVTVTFTLQIDHKELLMLSTLGSYGSNVAGLIYKSLTHDFSEEDWSELMRKLRDASSPMLGRARDCEQVFRGLKLAVRPMEKVIDAGKQGDETS